MIQTLSGDQTLMQSFVNVASANQFNFMAGSDLFSNTWYVLKIFVSDPTLQTAKFYPPLSLQTMSDLNYPIIYDFNHNFAMIALSPRATYWTL
jgi:hypothetical protein